MKKPKPQKTATSKIVQHVIRAPGKMALCNKNRRVILWAESVGAKVCPKCEKLLSNPEPES